MTHYLITETVNFAASAGNVESNCQKHIEAMQDAASRKVDVLLFPSLSLCGNNLGTFFTQESLLFAQEKAMKNILEESLKNPKLISVIGICLAVGNAVYSAQVAIQNGTFLAASLQEYIPSDEAYYHSTLSAWDQEAYREDLWVQYFDHDLPLVPYFEIERDGKSHTISLYHLEDFHSKNPRLSEDYAAGVDCYLVSAKEIKLRDLLSKRSNHIRALSAELEANVVYCNSGFGATSSDAVYGGEQFFFEAGRLLKENKNSLIFEEEKSTCTYALDLSYTRYLKRKTHFKAPVKKMRESGISWATLESLETFPSSEILTIAQAPLIPENFQDRNIMAEEILQIQAAALAKRLQHIHAKYFVLGVSGGLDSTLALMACLRAVKLLGLSNEAVLAIEMPGFGTGKETSTNSDKLLDALAVSRRKISIIPATSQHFEDIGHDPNTHDHTFENAQARERTQILMDIANQVNGIVIGTGDLSEIALGWCTYNGDQMSMYSVNHSIPKTMIRHILQHEASVFAQNKQGDVSEVLAAISKTAVSPELLPPTEDGEIQQKTEEIVGPYILHDFFLYHLLERGKSFTDIYALACHAFQAKDESQDSLSTEDEVFAPSEIKRVLAIFAKRFYQQQFKRMPSADGVSISNLHLSPRGGLHIPADLSVDEVLAEIEAL